MCVRVYGRVCVCTGAPPGGRLAKCNTIKVRNGKFRSVSGSPDVVGKAGKSLCQKSRVVALPLKPQKPFLHLVAHSMGPIVWPLLLFSSVAASGPYLPFSFFRQWDAVHYPYYFISDNFFFHVAPRTNLQPTRNFAQFT